MQVSMDSLNVKWKLLDLLADTWKDNNWYQSYYLLAAVVFTYFEVPAILDKNALVDFGSWTNFSRIASQG